MDYLLCGDLPYPAWKKRVSAQDLRNRRIRRYFVCRLKRSEARDFSHVRFNEGIILKSLKESAEEKTIVLVSHRVSTMNMADVVYEMENGRIS